MLIASVEGKPNVDDELKVRVGSVVGIYCYFAILRFPI